MLSMRRAGAWALALEQKDRCSMTVPYIFLSDDHFQRPGERVQVEGKTGRDQLLTFGFPVEPEVKIT